MTKLKDDYTIKDIVTEVSKYLSPSNIINQAYDYASKYLDENDIKSILNVANILTTLQADEETIVASFLHHLFTKNLVSFADLEKDFDVTIVKLAYGIYKLNKISFSTANDYLVEYYKKVIVGMSEDVRVIIITLAERVYLMRTLSNYDNSEQKEIANET
jgi:GTP pyrophosphokinase